MRRKKWIILGVCMLFCMINIAGCVKKESKKITIGSSVDKIVKEKTEKKETQNTKRKETKKQQEENSQESKEQGGQQTPGSDVDYDLTNMNKDMVYAAFYQLMVEQINILERHFASMAYIILDKTKKLEHTIIIAL